MYCINIYIFFFKFNIMYTIHIVKRFRAHCGVYAIEKNYCYLFIIISYGSNGNKTQRMSKDNVGNVKHVDTTMVEAGNVTVSNI